MNAVAALASFAHALEPNGMPAHLLQKMRTHLIDTLVAGISGTTTDTVGSASAVYAGGSGPAGDSALWGGGRADPRGAALVNGLAAHALEIDDTGGCDHSGAVVVPAALAMLGAEDRDISLDDLLCSMALGYESARRVQFFLGGYPSLNAAGWHSTAVCGPIGAAVAAARIMALDAAEIANAIGIATSTMGGGWSFKAGGGDNKSLHTGLPAAHGVESALLAKAGIMGTRAAFEDTWGGIGSLFAGASSDPGALTDGLGSRWVAFDASIKPFPTCASSHRMIQLTELVLVPLLASNEDIDQIVIRVGPLVAEMCGEARPGFLRTLKQRQLSIPYGIASALVSGKLTFSSIVAGSDEDAGIHALLEKMRVEVDDDIEGGHGEGSIAVRCRDTQHCVNTEEVVDPRFNITSVEGVLTKAEEVLHSVGAAGSIATLHDIASAPGRASASAVLAEFV